MTTTLSADLTPSFPEPSEIKVGKNWKKRQCRTREMAADSYDKGPRTPRAPTLKTATDGGGAVSVSLPSHRPHSHGSPLSAGWRQLFLSADVCARTRGAAPHPYPRDSLEFSQFARWAGAACWVQCVAEGRSGSQAGPLRPHLQNGASGRSASPFLL